MAACWLAAARAADIAYLDAVRGERAALDLLGCDYRLYSGPRGGQAWAGFDASGLLVIGPRGTEAGGASFSARDLLVNGQSDQVAYPLLDDPARPGFVHEGYWRQARELLGPLITLARGARAVLVGGHSMGGIEGHLIGHALATAPGVGPVRVVSLGAPQGLDPVAAAALGAAVPIDRLVLPLDPAPFWPFGGRNRVTLRPAGWAHPAPAIRLPAAGPFWRRHALSSYIRALSKLETAP
ncbi:hypothetical protein [Oceanibacterium hippocampi]|uniref:Alpha/beta hydrolase family protein n=1 Tax=Oceanibacterium hippocampi TaxID=745714 RepID=A0A1Y5U5J3_9PROT|nr:hypothetical protein [Oceanibacterium hippocampi]SLN77642.1 hypothetical protein OCH7691_04494 [Oceanibacterium hippocampi]